MWEGEREGGGDIARDSCLYLQGEEMQLLDNRPILRFQAHTRQLAGLYQCIAINGVGSPATATIQLRILCEYTFMKMHIA